MMKRVIMKTIITQYVLEFEDLKVIDAGIRLAISLVNRKSRQHPRISEKT